MATPAEALSRLLEAFDRLEVAYAVGGSAASSAHGIPRTTLDVDLVVDLRSDQIDALAEELKTEFYIDPGMIRDAFARGRAANLIHLKTAWKFDLFPLRTSRCDRTMFTAVPNSIGVCSGRFAPMAGKLSSAPSRRRRLARSEQTAEVDLRKTLSCASSNGIAMAERLRNANGTTYVEFAKPPATASM